MSRKTFGNLLRTRRELRGLKLRALARDIGVSHSYLIAIEKGTKPASEKIIAGVCEHLGVDRAWVDAQSGKLSKEAAARVASDTFFAALVNRIADVGANALKRISYFVETEIK